MNDQRLICEDCRQTLNTIYYFRLKCLKSKTNLITYISQLRTSSHVSGTISVRLRDVAREIKLTNEEIKIKCETADGCTISEDTSPPDTSSTAAAASRDEHNSPLVTIKEEFNIEDEPSFANINAGHVNVSEDNETIDGEINRSTIKQDIEINEDVTNISYDNFGNELEAEDTKRLLKQVNDGYIETPEDGSTGQPTIADTELNQKIESNFVDDNRENNIQYISVIPGSKRPYECTICKENFTEIRYVTRHLRRHSIERPHQCDICNRKFFEVQSLSSHMLTHSGDRPHECEICKKRFTEAGYLNRHKRKHKSTKTYECNKVEDGSSLISPMRIHSGETPYECEICEKKFRFNSNLTKHKLKIHSRGQKPLKCEVFGSAGDLNTHSEERLLCCEVSHSGEGPYICEMCKKIFLHKRNLAAHMQTHSSHACRYCDEKFAVKYDLILHAQVHSTDKRFACAICQKRFNYKSNLTKHVRIHTNERLYECDVCKKAFIQRQHLTTHMRIHSGERPHQCDICQRRFNVKSNLNKHVLVHCKPRPCELVASDAQLDSTRPVGT